jgi:hypothetical protein
LFSGGLDSLVGIINDLENTKRGKKVLAVSHFDSNSSGPNKDQMKLYEYLRKKFPNKIDWIQGKVTIGTKNAKGEKNQIDSNYRSRSILFISIGCYLIGSINNFNKLIIPENGTISLNFPLTPSRSSSLSTRTTHPYFIDELQQLLLTLGLKIQLLNPYSFKTKGEMIKGCTNDVVLKDIYEDSVSCGKRGRKTTWENKVGTNHCGTCIPCIYRRVSLHALNWDTQLYGNDLLSSNDPEKYKDVAALFDFLEMNYNKEQIKRILLINGSLPLEKLDDYADVVINSRNELLNWFKNKGNKKIKGILKL